MQKIVTVETEKKTKSGNIVKHKHNTIKNYSFPDFMVCFTRLGEKTRFTYSTVHTTSQ